MGKKLGKNVLDTEMARLYYQELTYIFLESDSVISTIPYMQSQHENQPVDKNFFLLFVIFLRVPSYCSEVPSQTSMKNTNFGGQHFQKK